jgi:hypothetical protein
MRLGELQSRSVHGDKEEISQPLPEIEPKNPNHPACNLDAILTELSQLLPKHRNEDNIRMDLRETEWKVVDGTHLAEDKDQ